jgi:FKBP-type peptidyl-prolyl cis-trans isomerase
MIRKSILSVFVLLIIMSLITLTSCDKTKSREQEELAKIQKYLDDNPALDFELKESGLYYYETEPGTGDVAVQHDTAYFFFQGYFLDGSSFGSNFGTEDTLVYPVAEGYLIPGVDEALTYMREGGKCKIVFPSNLGYGNSGYYMEPYTPLMFNLYLARIVRGPGAK